MGGGALSFLTWSEHHEMFPAVSAQLLQRTEERYQCLLAGFNH